jgi:hypothetical protein
MFLPNGSDRERMDIEAEVFSLLCSAENLERLYVKDVIGSEEYPPQN